MRIAGNYDVSGNTHRQTSIYVNKSYRWQPNHAGLKHPHKGLYYQVLLQSAKAGCILPDDQNATMNLS